jgi:hypothetical protein
MSGRQTRDNRVASVVHLIFENDLDVEAFPAVGAAIGDDVSCPRGVVRWESGEQVGHPTALDAADDVG